MIKAQKPGSRRLQWEELLSSWPQGGDSSPLRQELEKRQVQFQIPLGSLARTGKERPPVSCDVVSYQSRPCMLIAVGQAGKTSLLDAVALKKILRAQQIALAGSLPIAHFWLGHCQLAEDESETFPDLNAAGVVLEKAVQADSRGISQFFHSEQAEGMGGLLAAGLSRQYRLDTARGALPCAEFLTWLKECPPVSGGEPTKLDSDPTDVMPLSPSEEYDARDLIGSLADSGSFLEYRAEYGRTLICGYARIGNIAVGIVANQRKHVRQPGRPVEFGGVIYPESADKGARFILDCNQNRLPLLFLQDVNGFMVGREAEISGIIRSGAKMVNAVANSIVPKITLIVGGSYGAGNYAMCGKAYDPLFIFAWPTARYAVMGGDQAARTLSQLQIKQAEADGRQLSEQEKRALLERVKQSYDQQLDPRYAASRLWIDQIVLPSETRQLLFHAFQIAARARSKRELKTGVIQT